ncbi:hypothetical protein EJ05DRAFT_489433 [Pseudovirgaria hyperparasitica]|uniref:Uncharacterized protein n=1 Tax=Pseudovirgaria hyperparasitica TaxID=470096 RepID=A0A6A6VZG0_9PEZI|nr:uncharacterized protein EJ05DRAFT_489433 [Pseudovirgaria hyperparasitica]KAF2754191.1 hypothetical protein EJ05DRAFT_489433 [Pseudovirgaria hyperparasitica]
MALAPKFAGQIFAESRQPKAVHSLELYLDYVCPFSKKQFTTVYQSVLPLVRNKYAGKLQVVFRQQIQPWHPSSTLTHEAGIAVLKLAPNKFWEFSNALFEKQTEFFDVNVVNEARNDTYKRLGKIAAGVGIDENKFYELLEISDQPGEGGALNIGNGVTNDLKLLVKYNRLVGIHVTPTVLFNGAVEGSISSGFSKEDWEQWLAKNVV